MTPALRCVALALVLLLPVVAVAQAPGLGLSAAELMDQARVVEATLEAVRSQAMTDESLSGKADALVQDVEAKMAQLDPRAPERLLRLESLRVEAEAAAVRNDRPAFEAAMAKARQLQADLDPTRERALADSGLQLRTVAFQRELVDAMTVIEPEVPRLLRRLEAIAAQLGTKRGAQ